MKTNLCSSVSLALMLCVGRLSSQAGSHIWTGSISTAWSNPNNWIGGAPQIGEANVVLNFYEGATRHASTNDIGNISIDQIAFYGGNFVVGGYFITLTGAGYYNLVCQNVNNELALPIVMNSWVEYINVDFTCSLKLSGALSGPGGFFKFGDGTLFLAGNSANNYSSGTYVYGGTLSLGKTGAATAVPGPLVLGQTGDPNNSNTIDPTNIVQLAASQQIADGAPITVNPAGYLDLTGFDETIGPLTMVGGGIDANGGKLTLNGNVTGSSIWNNSPYIIGNLSLGGANRIFKTLTEGAIFLTGVVSDGGNSAGIIKMGTHGGLRLDGVTNTYAGVTSVGEGWLCAQQPGSLGSSAGGVVVSNGASFEIALNFHGPTETLTLMEGSALWAVGAYNSWEGDVILNGNAEIDVHSGNNEVLDIKGVISGSGNLTMKSGGTLRFSGPSPNTYNGQTTVLGSTIWNTASILELRKPNGVVSIPGPLIVGSATNPPENEIVMAYSDHQIADTAAVTVNPSGRLDLNDHLDTIGSLSGSNGIVNLNTGILTTGGDNSHSTFGGVIYGTGPISLVKIGAGRLVLTGNNNCTGKMIVNNGDLYINGLQSCSVDVNVGGKLHGQGLTGAITSLGGSVVPGDNIYAPTHGMMVAPYLTLDANSGFNIDLGGPAATGKYDQLYVGGSVALNNATLHLTQSSSGQLNDVFTIIRNNGPAPVAGTFAGFPEGAIINLSPLQRFKLSYLGGAGGHDVTLTQISDALPPVLSGITRSGNGQIELNGSGVIGQPYSVLANTNLATTDWLDIGMVLPDQNGVLHFVDPNAPNFTQRFYKFRAP